MKLYPRISRQALFLFLLVATLQLSTQFALAQEKVRLAQFGKEKFLLYLPLYVAMEEGYFKDEGIDLDLLFAGNDDQVFATVAGGSADFGIGDPVFTAIAQENGFEAKTVAMMITKLGSTGYTNNNDIPEITTADQLAGLRIGSLPKPSTTFTLLEEIKRRHEKLSSMQIIEAGLGGQLGLLEAGQVDIALDLEPTASLLETKGYRIVFHLNEYIDSQVITGLMSTQATINSRPAVVQGMVSALQRALTSIKEDSADKKATNAAIKIFPNIPREVVTKAVARMRAKGVYPESVVVPDAYWQRTLKTRLDSGQLKAPQQTSLSVDNQFADNAQSPTNTQSTANAQSTAANGVGYR